MTVWKKKPGQLEEQRAEMLLAEDRIGQAQKAERLWKDHQDFLQGQADPGRAERKAGAAFRGTEKTGAGKSGSQRESREG